jgi:hypothetical protein
MIADAVLDVIFTALISDLSPSCPALILTVSSPKRLEVTVVFPCPS